MLYLTRIRRQNNFRKYCFEEYSRPDYLSRAVVILVDDEFRIKSVQLNSALHGFVTISHGRGVVESSAWEDEAQARAHSGTSKYYSAQGMTGKSAKISKVVEDILSAAPSPSFGTLIRDFLASPARELIYPFKEFHLEPVRTTGQIHILRYQTIPAEYIPAGPELARILRHLNPVNIVMSIVTSFRRGIDGIQYVCASCGSTNRILLRTCAECGAPRPKLKVYTVFLFGLRALIDMTYVLYVALVLGFLITTIFGALRFYGPHSH